ncbi:bacteriophage tail fiber protein [Burkholderia cepacia]|uniref:Bacteriophage tail fiber protein n=1 Tax=Burkholderia cepacia TaxID=292 RepID=A0AAE8N9P5_BURCE|nr:hypothetical protein [Burkholderia cepacia]SPV11587.1 bacteriophage tail fiber protein [Burkholderia cepacia]
MFATDQATAVSAIPTPAPAGTPGFFTGGNPATGLPATIVDADWLNMIQQELLNILAAAGITPSKTAYNQVLSSLQSLFAGAATTGSFKGVYSFASSAALTPAMIGSVVDFYGGSAATFQLPEQILLLKGDLFMIANSGSAVLTVTCPADDSFAGGMSSIAVQPNESLAIVVSNATGQFIPAWGSATLQFSPSFLASLATNGYQQLPGGQIRQWGFASTSSGGLATVTFPKPFPNACLNAHATNSMSGATPPSTFMGVGTLTKTTMLVGAGNGASGVAFYWEATGN